MYQSCKSKATLYMWYVYYNILLYLLVNNRFLGPTGNHNLRVGDYAGLETRPSSDRVFKIYVSKTYQSCKSKAKL